MKSSKNLIMLLFEEFTFVKDPLQINCQIVAILLPIILSFETKDLGVTIPFAAGIDGCSFGILWHGDECWQSFVVGFAVGDVAKHSEIDLKKTFFDSTRMWFLFQ